MFSTLLVYFMGQCVFWHDSAKNNCGKGHQESSLIFFFVDTIKMVKGQQQLTSCCCSASRCNRRAVKTSRKPFMMGKKPFCPMILEERRKCVPPLFSSSCIFMGQFSHIHTYRSRLHFYQSYLKPHSY